MKVAIDIYSLSETGNNPTFDCFWFVKTTPSQKSLPRNGKHKRLLCCSFGLQQIEKRVPTQITNIWKNSTD